MENQIKAYIDGGHKKIQGWFESADMRFIYYLDQIQKQSQFQGDICEVGVWLGKSLVLLNLLSDSRETVYGFDSFIDNNLSKTKANLEQFCGSISNVKLTSGDNTNHTVAGLKEIITAPVRLLHIDAGHEYHEVLHDMLIFSPFVADTGIIIMDDYQTREFPAIEMAVMEFCSITSPRRFVPFMAGANKMFLCVEALSKHYLRKLTNLQPFLNRSRITRIKDYDVFVPYVTIPLDHKFIVDKVIHNGFPLEYTYDLAGLKSEAKKHAQQVQVTSQDDHSA